MEEKTVKSQADKSKARLIAAAVGGSILMHATVFGGWIWWESERAGSPDSPAQTHGREIPVRIAHPPKRQTPQQIRIEAQKSLNPVHEQTSRAQSRSAPLPAVSARRLLEDPETGLIFSVYFKAVKASLARQAQRAGFDSNQSLPVHFVLSRDGSLASVSVPPGTPEAVQTSVRRLLDAASPFPPFPSSIRHVSIAFDVLFRFDSNVLG